MDSAREKVASAWLKSLPLEEFGFTLHKGDFCDAEIWIDHSIIRHNEVRDIFASWLAEVCTEVRVEPPLQPITAETQSGASAIGGCDIIRSFQLFR
uniref:Uncharacterized protein n=1 Tax=Amphimedon queenslandica TaxID=400682 RepID=A0A1X7VYN2_AMPQE